MSYQRVIPRDLFNEAKLLKCLGALYIGLEKLGLESLLEYDNEPFDVYQCQESGSFSVENIKLTVHTNHVLLCTPLNSRAPYPLIATTDFDFDREYRVFTDDGELTPEFIAMVRRPAPDFWVCADCVQAIAYGEYSELEEDRAAEIEAGIAAAGGHIAVSFEVDDFSTKPCDCCGSPLAGERNACVVIADQPEVSPPLLDDDQVKEALRWYVDGKDLVTIAQHYSISVEQLKAELRGESNA